MEPSQFRFLPPRDTDSHCSPVQGALSTVQISPTLAYATVIFPSCNQISQSLLVEGIVSAFNMSSLLARHGWPGKSSPALGHPLYMSSRTCLPSQHRQRHFLISIQFFRPFTFFDRQNPGPSFYNDFLINPCPIPPHHTRSSSTFQKPPTPPTKPCSPRRR
jgi:hypothetical protein